MIHKKFEANEAGNDFVVGDIHGMYDEFRQALIDAGFDKSKDRCFSVGDLIDRGPKSDECFELIYEPWFHCVRGNHEQLMLDAYQNGTYDLWQWNGGGWADHWDKSLLKYQLRMIDEMPIAITVNVPGGRIGITHAEPPVNDWNDIGTLSERQIQEALWARTALKEAVPVNTANVLATFHGHTILKHPARLGNAVFIDTGSFATGVITVVNLANFFHGFYSARH